MGSALHKFFLTVLLLVLITGKTFAATYDWVGTSLTGGVYNWNNKLNWQVNGVAASTTPGPTDAVTIAVNSFGNDPTITDAQKCASITFGVFDNFTLTVNGTLTVSGDITQNNDPNLNQTTILAGSGTIICNNFNLGDNTQPGAGSGIVINLSSQVNQLTVNGNIVLNAAGNGGNGIEYPFFSLDANKITLYGQIINKTYNSPTFEGVGDPSYPGYGLFQMDSYDDDTTLELLNAAAIATPVPTGFTIDLTNNGLGKGTVIYDAASGTQTVYTSATSGLGINAYNYDYLTLKGASNKTVLGGALTVGKDLTTAGGGTVNLTTNNPVITVKGSWANSATVNQGSGDITVATDLQNSTNPFTLGSGDLTVGNNVQINSAKIIAGAGTFTINGDFQNVNGTLKCSAGDIIFKGDYTNSKTFTAGTGTVYFSGTANTLLDNSTTGTLFNKVTFNSGTSTMAAGNGNFTVSSSGTLAMVSPAKLIAGTSSAAYLTLRSDATGSATVSAISGTSSITGFVNVQRYVSGGSSAYRAYRLLSSPVYVATVGGNNVSSLDYIAASTLVTGVAAGSGFDRVGNPSIYLFREDKAYSNASFTSGNFWGVSKINNTPSYNIYLNSLTSNYNIPVGNGVFFFFRGNRTSNLANKYTAGTVAESVTMTATGTLNQGQITVKDWYKPTSANLGHTTTTGNNIIRGYNLVGNPYASSIDWDLFNTTTISSGIYAANVKPTFYIYNSVNKNYAVYTRGSGGVGTNGATNIIPSGQGFFVMATNASAKLVFNESAKTSAQVSGVNLLLGKPADNANVQYLRLQLAQDSINTDDIIVRFNSNASADYVVNEDAPYKQGSGAVSLCSISDNNVDLAINNLPLPKKSEAIGLSVNFIADGTYKLNLTQLVGIPQLYDIWLMDAYKNDSLDMRHNPTYAFNIYKNDSTTFGSKRFSLFIRQNPAYAYRLINFTASKQATSVQAVWTTVNEANYTHFSVERSTDDGKTFEIIGGTLSSDQGTYTLMDKNPVTGKNLYRLQQEDLNGTITYSKVVTVMYSDRITAIAAGKLNVYPNPASSVINLAIAPDINAGSYKISITNSSGVLIKESAFAANSWQSNVNNLLPGTYLIQVVNGKDKSLIGKTKFVKL